MFQKKFKSRVPHIKGSRASIKNAQLVMSCGVPSLDAVIGGGLPVGTLLLIEEDLYGIFSKVFLQYFIAEGVANEHGVYLASRDFDPQTLINDIPAPVPLNEGSGVPKRSSSLEQPEMEIAWRYQNLRQIDPVVGEENSLLGHQFDLTQKMPKELLDSASINTWDGSQTSSSDYFLELLRSIKDVLSDGKYCTNNESESNILRIGIHSLGSGFWLHNMQTVQHFRHNRCLSQFLLGLRSLLRSSYASAMVTIPSHLFQDSVIMENCMNQSDVALRLDSFVGSDRETSPFYKEYHGLLHVNKLGSVNTLSVYVPESRDLAFKLRRRKFVIEKLHLPPELQETTEREQDELFPAHAPSSGCNPDGRQKNKLDF